jgi:hypothetical protein
MKIQFYRDEQNEPQSIMLEGANLILPHFLYIEIRRGSQSWFDIILEVIKFPNENNVYLGTGDAHSLDYIDGKIKIFNEYVDEELCPAVVFIKPWQLLKAMIYWRMFCANDLGFDEYTLEIEEK